ncbi:MAG: ATP synthase F1 subunit epsilon [Candidatus Pacebacteria bacterium]|nr:ATP synthase F1 subunit epsilon [Candidatus Paceibacterota bacterium]MBP9866913.1 ATP synthase F1 subunit epsilon [Candidatus Paceibacterota bacterium]
MLKLKVVTPDKVLVDEIVDNVSIPTTTGMVTVLNKHIPLVSTIKAGEMTIRKGGSDIGYAVYKGLVNVRLHTKGLTEVVVLLEKGESVEELDHDRAQEALARAKAMAEEKEDDVDFGIFEGLVEKEVNRVRVAMKYRKH